MTADAKQILDYANFIQGEKSPEFVEVDSACLTPELFKDPESPEDHPPLLLFDEEHGKTNVCSVAEKVVQVRL